MQERDSISQKYEGKTKSSKRLNQITRKKKKRTVASPLYAQSPLLAPVPLLRFRLLFLLASEKTLKIHERSETK